MAMTIASQKTQPIWRARLLLVFLRTRAAFHLGIEERTILTCMVGRTLARL